jgi:hypothetical protein
MLDKLYLNFNGTHRTDSCASTTREVFSAGFRPRVSVKGPVNSWANEDLGCDQHSPMESAPVLAAGCKTATA